MNSQTNAPPQDPRLRVEVHVCADEDAPDIGVDFLHCARCLDEWTELFQGTCTPRDYARQQCAIAADGRISVRCVRHDCNVCTFTLRAIKNTTKKGATR